MTYLSLLKRAVLQPSWGFSIYKKTRQIGGVSVQRAAL